MTRGKGKKTMLAHNIRHSLFEHTATELAAIKVALDKNKDEEEDSEPSWTRFAELGKNWEFPHADTRLSEAAWYKKGGVVMLRGCAVAKSEADTTIATLPEGVRPSSIERFQCMTMKGDSSKCHATPVTIHPDGTITVYSVHEGELWLSGISFTIA